MSIVVITPGAQSTVQDLGRPGHRHLGVGLAGAADSPSLRLANIIVRNAQEAAGIEITLNGPALRFERDVQIAICGADLAAEAENRTIEMRRPQQLQAGEVLRLGSCQRGARAYLAVAGGIAVDEVLRSRSTDLGAGFGGHLGRALRAGDRLSIGDAAAISTGKRFFVHEDTLPAQGPCMLRVVIGTHGSRCIATLTEAAFHVGAESSRMGLRIEGPRLFADVETDALISEPVTPGTVQLPPSGAPIVLGVEAPTTGGYPRIAHVITADLPRVGQLRPGDAVKFRLVSMDEARTALAAQERRLALLSLALRTKKESSS